MSDVSSDDRFYRRIDAGDAESFRRLFSRHAPLAVALIARLVGRPLAQDIVQETFLLLWSRRWHEQDQGSIQSWLFANAHHRAVEMIRRGEALPGPTADRLQTIVDAAAMPPRWLDPTTRARRAVALHAMMGLPVDERAPIELMYIRGLSRRQIADRLRVPLSEVRARSTAGLLHLEQALRSIGGYGSTHAVLVSALSPGSGRLESRPGARSPA
jgi:RNA polymerase sigma-70 factor (ECF subfamily)